MAVKTEKALCSSTLNPNAAHFVPSYFECVEDFSPDWWSMVKSSPAFRDYWIRQCWEDEPQPEPEIDGDDDDDDDLFDEEDLEQAAAEAEALKEQDLNLCGSPKPRGIKAVVSAADLGVVERERPPREAREKIVQVPLKLAAAQMRKSSAVNCRIQQPR